MNSAGIDQTVQAPPWSRENSYEANNLSHLALEKKKKQPALLGWMSKTFLDYRSPSFVRGLNLLLNAD